MSELIEEFKFDATTTLDDAARKLDALVEQN